MSDVLIVRLDHLGDLVLTTPLFRALSKAGHRVTVVARQSSLPVLEGNPYIYNLLASEDLAPDFPRGLLALGGAIRRLQPEVVMLPHAKPRRLLFAVRSSFFGRMIVMWGGIPSRLLLCNSLRSGLPERVRHYSDIMLDMARALNVPPDGVNPEIFLSDIEKKNARNLLRERFGDRKVLVIHPGCAGNTCNLPIDSYTALARRLLSSTDVGIVFSGISPEREVFVGKLSEFEGNERVWNTMGEFSLRKYCGIIEASDLVVTPSTGPLHLASALGRSTLSPFCCRAGLSKEVWGNLSAKSIVLEPPSRVCAGRNKGKYCDFQGCINVEKLLQSCIDLLAIA